MSPRSGTVWLVPLLIFTKKSGKSANLVSIFDLSHLALAVFGNVKHALGFGSTHDWLMSYFTFRPFLLSF